MLSSMRSLQRDKTGVDLGPSISTLLCRLVMIRFHSRFLCRFDFELGMSYVLNLMIEVVRAVAVFGRLTRTRWQECMMKNWAYRLITFGLALCWISNFALADLTMSAFEPGKYQGKSELSYQLHSPGGQKTGEPLPLVVFLHGVGARGDDNEIQLTHTKFLDHINQSGFFGDQACHILAPQCSKQARWSGDTLSDLFGLIGEVASQRSVDPNRIYITGQSMGGYGTWRALQEKPRLFAAAVPICGGGKTSAAEKFSSVPIWVFHGDADTVVKPSQSREMVAALKKAGGQPKYTELKGVGHNSWQAAYSDADLWRWMFQQKRKDRQSATGNSK